MQFVFLVIFIVLLAACEGADQSGGVMIPAPPRNMDPAILSKGKAIYDKHCKRCHLTDAVGSAMWEVQGPDGKYPAPPLNGAAHTWHHPKEVLVRVIKEGSPGGMGNMPAMGGKLADQDVEAVITWFQSLWSEQAYQTWYETDMAHHEH